MELTTKDWKEFRIGDLFSVETCKGVDAGSLCLNKNYSENTPYEFIGRTNDNYGLQGYIGDLGFPVNNSETITISQVGTIVAQIRTSEYYTSQNIFKLTPLKFEPNQWNLLFIVTLLNKMLLKYTGYASYPIQKSLKNEFILLPSKNDEPDWDFMEEFIKEIEEKYIENVDKYNQENIDKALSVTGLTMVDLDDDLKVKPADRYEEFRVGDLFDVSTIRGVNNESLNNDYSKGKYRYITRTSLNNGISSITGKIGGLEIQKSNTFSLGLLGMNFFFQTEPWYAGQFVRNISPKFEINRPLSLYFGTLFNKRSKSYQSVLIRDFDKIFKNEKIKLPAIDENTPDFDYMEKVIYIYIKKVIKSWKMDNEKEIRALKSVINK